MRSGRTTTFLLTDLITPAAGTAIAAQATPSDLVIEVYLEGGQLAYRPAGQPVVAGRRLTSNV